MIGFLQPLLLAALPLAALPLLLHLLARRDPPTVSFPSVRYLADATRDHQRRLRLRHWLLLLLRSLLIAAVVLAAAGPTLPAGAPGEHAPAALVVILDNSPSSAAVRGGEPTLDRLREAARRALAGATPADALWLVTADGEPRRGDAPTLGALVEALAPAAQRLDLGAAVTRAQELLDTDARPGAVLLLTDLQASAVSAASPGRPLLVGRPAGEPPPNRGIASIATGPQPWSASGGTVRLTAAGDSTAVPVQVRLGPAAPRQALLGAGQPAELQLPAPTTGWWVLSAELAPDELRLDDRAVAAVRVLPPAAVAWDTADVHLHAALSVLSEGGRIRRGTDVRVDDLGPAASLVLPPGDPARLGALNRALTARGVPWQFGELLTRSGRVDSGGPGAGVAVEQRYQLVPGGSGRTGVLATVQGEPWLVQAGPVVLVGSRLAPAWTELPLRAEFVPLLDQLLNRTLRGEVTLLTAAPGDVVPLPDRVERVRAGDQSWQVEGGGRFVPREPGLHALEAGNDTVGMLAVNPDPRESELRAADDGRVRALWAGARLLAPLAAADAIFGEVSRAGLRGPLLWLAALLAVVEMAFAGRVRRG